MAVSAPLLSSTAGWWAAVRYVTSLRHGGPAGHHLIVAIALAVGHCRILAMVYFSNLYFVRSIVEPVASITETATAHRRRQLWRPDRERSLTTRSAT